MSERDNGEQWQEQWGTVKFVPHLKGLFTPAKYCHEGQQAQHCQVYKLAIAMYQTIQKLISIYYCP